MAEPPIEAGKPAPGRISAAEADERLKALPGWERDGETIKKTFKLPGFADAIGLVARVGVIAAEQDHHPDINIRWNKVKLVYSTHSAGGLTELDFAAAEAIEGRRSGGAPGA